VLSSDHAIVVVVHDEAKSQVANDFEQSLVCEIGEAIAALQDAEFDAVANVGIVVPHRKQRAALQQALPGLSRIEVGEDTLRTSAIDTVERFQGGERTLILISATESDPQFILSTSEFILDQRRLTVALSRAKKKLILVASESIFQVFSPDEWVFENAQMWKNLLRRTCTERLWEGERSGHRVRVYGNVPEQPEAEPMAFVSTVD
jgi:AAA domain